AEDVRDPGRGQLAMEQPVLRPEPRVAAPDVEGEEGGTPREAAPELPDERVGAGIGVRTRRAQIERPASQGIRRMEVAAPRLDDRESLQVMERRGRSVLHAACRR